MCGLKSHLTVSHVLSLVVNYCRASVWLQTLAKAEE